MTIQIKNTGVVSGTWAGQEIAAATYYAVDPTELSLFANSGKVFTDVGSGLLLINDGSTDFTDPVKGWAFLTGLLPTEVALPMVSPISGRPEFVMIEAEGSGEAICSHDFTDKCTWYQKSVQVTAETPTLDTGATYNLANTSIIDSSHGRITFEDNYCVAQLFHAYDGATELEQDVDYTVDFENGKITIDPSYTLTGALTVDYCYSNGSTYTLVPAPGKVFKIKDAEIQIAKNIAMKPLVFEVWAYNPADLPNKVVVFSRKYKNLKDIVNVCRSGKGSIPMVCSLTEETLTFPFQYQRAIALEHGKGMELRISTVGDLEMGGSFGTITLYVIEEDEVV